MPFGFGGKRKKNGDGEDDAAKKAQQEEALRQEEEARRLREIEERNEQLLPWDVEQKVAVVLNPIKVPFIIVAGLLGSVAELRIGIVAEDTWYRGFFGSGPECVVHKADYGKLTASARDSEEVGTLMDKLDDLLLPVVSWLNMSVHKIASNCTTEYNITRCDLLNGPLLNWSFAPDDCYVEYDEAKERCTGESELSEMPGMRHESSGLIRSCYVPYALVWMLFKLIWLPGYYIDRAARLAADGTGPQPEPIMKLISEPTCGKYRLGRCGRCAGTLGMLGQVSKVIRFSLLPNTLILPLTSMRFVEQCQDKYIIYSQNADFGFWIYVWLLFEVVTTLILYVAAQTVLGGKALGTTWYGMYNFFSGVRTVVALNMYIFDLVCCFSWRFWKGFSVILQLVFALDLTVNATFDIARTVANTVVALDYLQFTIMIWSFLCPRLIARLPIPECLREWTARPDEWTARPDATVAAAAEEKARARPEPASSSLPGAQRRRASSSSSASASSASSASASSASGVGPPPPPKKPTVGTSDALSSDEPSGGGPVTAPGVDRQQQVRALLSAPRQTAQDAMGYIFAAPRLQALIPDRAWLLGRGAAAADDSDDSSVDSDDSSAGLR